MKKIRNIKHLKREQQKLQERQLTLEKEMQESLKKIKKSILPHNVAKDLISEWFLNKITKKIKGGFFVI